MPASKIFAVAGALFSQAAGAAVGDAVAMVQTAAQAGQAATRRAMSHSVAGRAMAAQDALSAGAAAAIGDQFNHFNCTKYPKLCEAPFDCGTFSSDEMFTMVSRGFAPEGHGNLRTWCFSPDYQDYMHACIVEKDLVKAAKIQFDWSVERHNSTGVDELDGSYCFIEGHCSNAAVTKDTTLQEADQMCDERYGEDAWRKIGMLGYPMPKMGDPKGASPQTGFHDPAVTRTFLKFACAMGNYHCDIMYCKETYCKNPYYVRKYGHLLPKAPGHLLQARFRV